MIRAFRTMVACLALTDENVCATTRRTTMPKNDKHQCHGADDDHSWQFSVVRLGIIYSDPELYRRGVETHRVGR